MDRREFLKGALAAGLTPALSQAEEKPATVEGIERRALGRTGRRLSVLGFGGIIVMNQTPEEAVSYVAEAFERGINYFDVAPSYGNAQERLGPALKPYRDRVFLACKTTQRDAAKAREELDGSLRMLQTDHVDLYQLHALAKLEDVEKVFAPGGAMEVYLKAREAGKIRFIGFSAHSEEAALAALDRFDFDTMLFPLNFATWHKNNFGPAVFKRAQEKKMGILALKAMAHQVWPAEIKRNDRKWNKAWYQPLDEAGQIALALRFTLGLPVTAAIPPGHWPLFKMALQCVAGGITPLSKDETRMLKQIAAASNPIFPQHA